MTTKDKEQLQKHLLQGFGTLKHIVEVMHQSVEDWYIIDQEKKDSLPHTTGFWFVEQELNEPNTWAPVPGHRNYNEEKDAIAAVDWYRKNLPNYQYRHSFYTRSQ